MLKIDVTVELSEEALRIMGRNAVKRVVEKQIVDQVNDAFTSAADALAPKLTAKIVGLTDVE